MRPRVTILLAVVAVAGAVTVVALILRGAVEDIENGSRIEGSPARLTNRVAGATANSNGMTALRRRSRPGGLRRESF